MIQALGVTSVEVLDVLCKGYSISFESDSPLVSFP